MRRRLLGVLCVLVALGSVASGCAYRYQTRNFDLTTPESAQSSFIYDSRGNQITFLRADENRVYKRIDEIPLVLQRAVVAIEDERFYYHKGFDLKGLNYNGPKVAKFLVG